MTLTELIAMTRLLSRNINGYIFTNEIITLFINQCIDRLKQYKVFGDMAHLSTGSDVPILLPTSYHYMIALFAASRCLDMDERFYEGTEKRNEFEALLDELIAEIQSGNLVIYNSDTAVEDTTSYIDAITDVYYAISEDADIDDGVDGV